MLQKSSKCQKLLGFKSILMSHYVVKCNNDASKMVKLISISSKNYFFINFNQLDIN